MTEALETVAGRRGWIISDGKTGNDVQTRGVFDALRLEYEVKRVAPAGHLAGAVAVGARSARPSASARRRANSIRPGPSSPSAIGRLTTPYIRRLKQLAGLATYTIILQNPKVSLRTADLFWVPEHDTRRGANVITTLTAPHSFTAAAPAASCARPCRPTSPRCPAPRVAVLLGGPNGDYRYTPGRARAPGRGAAIARRGSGAGLMITPSRRTPAEVTAFVREATAGMQRLLWDGEGANPYPAFLAHADAFIVPADSVNMTGEPCATGKPVYVFAPDGGSPKFTRFHEALRRHGATRPLPDPLRAARDLELRTAQLVGYDRGRDRAALGEAAADAGHATAGACRRGLTP